MASVTTRVAVPGDAAGLVDVHIRSWQRAYAGIVPAEVLDALDTRREERVGQFRRRFAEVSPRFRTVVAVDSAVPVGAGPADGVPAAGAGAGPVIGLVTFGPYRLEQGRRDGPVDHSVGEVLAIYVDPAHHGRGAGRALLAASVTALRATGAGEIRLWVLEANTPAQRFYRRCGFLPDGGRHLFRVHRPEGTPVDLPEIRMTLPAGSPGAGRTM